MSSMALMNMRDRHHQAGDTIVEVVISVAVISAVLIGAYTLTVQSTQAVRTSEEHAQALQLLQGQVELLRNAAGTAGVLAESPTSLTTPFCLYNTGGSPARYLSTDNAHCLLDNLYYLSITGPPSLPPSGTTTFSLTATWAGLGGNNNSVGLAYKVEVL